MKCSLPNATNLKSKFRTISFLLVFLSALHTARAQKTPNSSGTPAASVTYAGYENDQLFFALKYNNRSGERYTVTITDEDGSVLFSQVYADRQFAKTFKVPATAGDVIFIISNPKNRQEKKFEARLERHVKEEFTVTKMSERP